MAHREHELSPLCWCNPYVEYESASGSKLWVHRTDDNEKPPPEILMEAIADIVFDDTEDNGITRE